MLMILSRYKLVAEAVAALALLAGLLYGFHVFCEHEREIGRVEVQALWDKQKAADKFAADTLQATWQKAWAASINKGSENAQLLQTQAGITRVAADRLRDATTNVKQLLSDASADTARKYAAAYADVFNDCVVRYREMGEKAQGHANDVKTLSDAFPKNKPQ